jgi:hypothetical protein
MRIDNDAGGTGWYFDSTPLDDVEFTGLASSYQASFVDPTSNFKDFYETVTHEIGHALGIYSNSTPANDRLFQLTSPVGTDQIDMVSQLRQFNNPSGQFGVIVTFTDSGGNHTYEGPADPSFPLIQTHPNDLMNPGRSLPQVSTNAVTRRFITDLDAKILADAYDYTVALPSTLDSAH